MNRRQNTTTMDDPASRWGIPFHPHANFTPQAGSLRRTVPDNDSTHQNKHDTAEIASPQNEFCHVPSNPKSGGTKRDRSGRLKTVPCASPNVQHDETSCSDTGWSSDSERDSDSDSSLGGYDTDEHDESADEEGDFAANERALSPTHPFQRFRKDLMPFMLRQFQKWMASVRYIEPPGHRLRNRKRAKITRYLLEEEDPNDSSIVMISPIHGYYHLACPFFVFNQQRHRSCVLSHDFRSIEALLDHILRDHKEPPFCPICGGVFDTFKNRDDHIRRRTCEPRDHEEVDGVNHAQRLKLIRRDHSSLPEEERWCRIYAIIFNCKHRGSVYLTEGLELKISLLRDYWVRNGLLSIREYLSGNGYGSALEEKRDEVSALGELVFRDLMIGIQEREDG